ncbi:MAG: hypothetical protein DHS20C14_04930 [Phycisphaeraceae bacterium]|nr:MAG: hypothetical protein DHS20C14_04930 [Phycisphaeraceae bacterium]
MADEQKQPEVTPDIAVFNWGRQTMTLAQMVRAGREGITETRETTEAAMKVAHEAAQMLWRDAVTAAGEAPKLGQVMEGYIPAVLGWANEHLDANG